MIYKTVLGKITEGYVESQQGVFWFTRKIPHKGFGYILLKKDRKGYEPIRLLKIT